MTQLGQVGSRLVAVVQRTPSVEYRTVPRVSGRDWTAVPIGKGNKQVGCCHTHTAECCWRIKSMRLGQLPKEEYTDRTRGWLMLTDQLTHASAGVYPHNNWSQSFRLFFFFPSDADARREQSDFSGPVRARTVVRVCQFAGLRTALQSGQHKSCYLTVSNTSLTQVQLALVSSLPQFVHNKGFHKQPV